MKLGKRPATHDARDLCFAHYRDNTRLRQAPVGYGHQALVRDSWGMLGNDLWGDCAWAGPAHEHMLTSAAAGSQVQFTTGDVLAAYSAGTGFDANAGPSGENPTDKGSDVRDVLKYRQKTGLIDAAGTTHRIGAYVALEPGNWTELLDALYLFEAVGMGFQFPSSAMSQFDAGKPWSVVSGAKIEGGHYVPVFGRPSVSDGLCVTWGSEQKFTKSFYEKYCDEAWCILSPEMLSGGKSLEGFALDALTADLQALAA